MNDKALESFETFYAPFRGVTIAALGVDTANNIETASKTAYCVGWVILCRHG